MQYFGYEYILAMGEPKGFTGDWQNDAGVLATANELLTGRTIEFRPSISIQTSPNWKDHSNIQGGSARSKIGHDDFRLTFWTGGVEEFYYGGFATIEDGKMKIIFNKDSSGDLMPVRIEYLFDLDDAQALVDSMKDWRRSGGMGQSSVSVGTIEGVVKLNGRQNGVPWELECKQEVYCIAAPWHVS